MFLFTGPVLQILATIFEWVMGNFFSMMVFGVFSVFWLSFGLLQLPTLDLAAAYLMSGTDVLAGASSRAYNAAIALYLVVWGCAMLTVWVSRSGSHVLGLSALDNSCLCFDIHPGCYS
jgi:uncharacterized protein